MGGFELFEFRAVFSFSLQDFDGFFCFSEFHVALGEQLVSLLVVGDQLLEGELSILHLRDDGFQLLKALLESLDRVLFLGAHGRDYAGKFLRFKEMKTGRLF